MRLTSLLVMVLITGVAWGETLDSKLIVNANVQYESVQTVSTFPAPVVAFRKEGALTQKTKQAILDQLAYPLVRSSREPIAAIVIECNADTRGRLSIEVLYSNGNYHGLMVSWLDPDNLDRSAVEQLLRNPRVD